MSAHPKLDEAIKRGEIQQCPHCQAYWVAACHIHECLPMVRFQREQLRADLKRAVGLLKDLASQSRHDVAGYTCVNREKLLRINAFLAEHKDDA